MPRTDCRGQQRNEIMKEDCTANKKRSEKQTPEHSKLENAMGRSKF